jgi:hypothetical protein
VPVVWVAPGVQVEVALVVQVVPVEEVVVQVVEEVVVQVVVTPEQGLPPSPLSRFAPLSR